MTLLPIKVSYFSEHRKSNCSGNTDSGINDCHINIDSVTCMDNSDQVTPDSETSILIQNEYAQNSNHLARVENGLGNSHFEVNNGVNDAVSQRAVQGSAGSGCQTVTCVEILPSQESDSTSTNPGFRSRSCPQNVDGSNRRRTRTISQQTESQLNENDHGDPGIDENDRLLQNTQESDFNQPQRLNEADEQEVLNPPKEHEARNLPPTKSSMKGRPPVDHRFEHDDVYNMERSSQNSMRICGGCSMKASLSVKGDSILEGKSLRDSIKYRLDCESGCKETDDNETLVKPVDDNETQLKNTDDETNMNVIGGEICTVTEDKALANENSSFESPERHKRQENAEDQGKQVYDEPSSVLNVNSGSNESLEKGVVDSSGYKSMTSGSGNEETVLKGIEEVASKEPEQETVSKKAMGEMMIERVLEETTDDTPEAKVTQKNQPIDLRAVVSPKAKPESAPKEIKPETAQKTGTDAVIPDVTIISEASRDVVVEQVSSETALKGRYEPALEVTLQATPTEASPATTVPMLRPQEAKPRSVASTVRKTAAEVFAILET